MGRQKYRFQPTEAEIAKIRAEWGVRKVTSIARDLNVSDDVLSLYARNELGLPRRSFRVMDDNHWTAEEDAIIVADIHNHVGIRETIGKLPKRSAVAVTSRRARLLKAQKDEDLARLIEERRQRFAGDKPTALEPLKYTLDECPRVTFAEAVQWMRQAKKDWQRPSDDRAAWREINGQRLYGPVPVPPFLPIKHPTHNDNHRIAKAPMPAWEVGA